MTELGMKGCGESKLWVRSTWAFPILDFRLQLGGLPLSGKEDTGCQDSGLLAR